MSAHAPIFILLHRTYESRVLLHDVSRERGLSRYSYSNQ